MMLLLLLFSVSWLGGWGSSLPDSATVAGWGFINTLSDSTDWKLAGLGENIDRDGSIYNWINPTNIYVCDGTNAATVDVIIIDDYSDWLRATNFGFTTDDIPSGVKIFGIEVKIKRQANYRGSRAVKDDAIYLRKTSGQVGDSKPNAIQWLDNSWEEITYGGPTDDWNAGLTDSDIRSSGFGVDLSIYQTGPAEASVTALVDCISIKVFYAYYPRVDSSAVAGWGFFNAKSDWVDTLTFQSTIYDPDNIQSTIDAVPVLAVESIFYPNGIKILGVGIKTNANSTYSVNFEEWTSPLDVSPSTILTIATSASAEADSIGPMADSDIAVGSIIYVDLPPDDIDLLEVWGAFYIK